MKRQILIELDLPEFGGDDRLVDLAKRLMREHPEVTAEALLNGKEAVALYEGQWDGVTAAFDKADSWDDDRLQLAYEDGEDDTAENIEQAMRDRHELLNELKVARGLAFNFDEHWTPVTKDDGDVQFLSVPEGDERTIWTVLDCDGELSIAPGEFLVNRMYYIQTTEPWTDADTEKEWIY